MDLLGIARTLVRHKILSAVILLATLAGAAGYWVVAPQQWQASGTYALINPTPPTAAQIAARPKLGLLNANNPYLGLGDTTTVASVLSALMTNKAAQSAIVKAGGSTNFAVAPSNQFNAAGKLVEVTVTAPTELEAVRQAQLVDATLVTTLRAAQKVYGADDRYLIQALPVTVPTGATQVISGTLRSVIVLGVGGLIVLFVALSIAEAFRIRREERDVAVALPGRHAPRSSDPATPRSSDPATPRSGADWARTHDDDGGRRSATDAVTGPAVDTPAPEADRAGGEPVAADPDDGADAAERNGPTGPATERGGAGRGAARTRTRRPGRSSGTAPVNSVTAEPARRATARSVVGKPAGRAGGGPSAAVGSERRRGTEVPWADGIDPPNRARR